MANPGAKAGLDSWLIRIDFPRMEIDHSRLAFYIIDVPKRPGRHVVWKKTKIPSTGDAPIHIAVPYRGGREFKDAIPGGGVLQVWKAWSIGNAVEVVPDREQ